LEGGVLKGFKVSPAGAAKGSMKIANRQFREQLGREKSVDKRTINTLL